MLGSNCQSWTCFKKELWSLEVIIWDSSLFTQLDSRFVDSKLNKMAHELGWLKKSGPLVKTLFNSHLPPHFHPPEVKTPQPAIIYLVTVFFAFSLFPRSLPDWAWKRRRRFQRLAYLSKILRGSRRMISSSHEVERSNYYCTYGLSP